jgi:thiamine phosphate synthase YjbQ (UPF0047 family)
MIKHLTVDIPGQGLHEITDRIEAVVREAGMKEGLCTLFVQHTSASLLIDADHPWSAPLWGALKRVQFCSRQNCQENADPAVKHDLEHWFNRLAPENIVGNKIWHASARPEGEGQDGPSQNDPLYTHQNEGPDDMPGHIKAALTAAHLSIPFSGGRLALGTWQGIYLWEHRRRRGARQIVVHLGE